MSNIAERFWAKYADGNLYVRPSDGARVCRSCTRAHVSRYKGRKRADRSTAD